MMRSYKRALRPVRRRGRTLGAFAERWLAVQRFRVKESTYNKYATALEKHILPRLGAYAPESISRGVLEEFALALQTESALSAKSAHDVLTLLGSLLRYAGCIAPEALPYPKIAPKSIRVLSREEERTVRRHLAQEPEEWRFGVLLALETGLRLGEVCALRWKCVSPEDGTVRIESAVQRLQDRSGEGTRTRLVTGSPKSSSSLREIPLPEDLRELAARIRRPDGQYVLTGTEKCPDPRTVQYRFAALMRECGLEGVHFHTLRHTFATRAAEVGVDIKSLSEILGHAGTAVTLDRYVHSSLERKREELKKLVNSEW